MTSRPPFRRSADGVGTSSFSAADRRAETPEALPSAPLCPFCERSDTEIMNAFGSHASVSTYWCRACRSPFELMKWRSGA